MKRRQSASRSHSAAPGLVLLALSLGLTMWGGRLPPNWEFLRSALWPFWMLTALLMKPSGLVRGWPSHDNLPELTRAARQEPFVLLFYFASLVIICFTVGGFFSLALRWRRGIPISLPIELSA